MSSPIFFDPTGKRRKRTARAFTVLIVMVLAIAAVFASTVVTVPKTPSLEFTGERYQPLPFRTQVARLKRQVRKVIAGTRADPPAKGVPLSVGFYVPWDTESLDSLRRNLPQMDWIIATNGAITGQDNRLHMLQDNRLTALLANRLHRPQLMLMIQNVNRGVWDGRGMRVLLTHRLIQRQLLADAIADAKAQHAQGLVFDLEELPRDLLDNYYRFLVRAHAEMQKAGLRLSVTVPAGDPTWNLKDFARPVDTLIFMDYDENEQSGPPGPVASQQFFESELARARAAVPDSKLIVALGAYGYDWHDNTADPMTIEEAWQVARDSGIMPTFDPHTGNSGLAYADSGTNHTVWFMDAAANWNQLHAIPRNVSGVALWRLGGEDPGYWTALHAWRTGAARPDIAAMPQSHGTDIEGTGEILRIGGEPHPGARTVTFDAANRITGMTYTALPTPYVVQRTGNIPKKIALTFDDGPDPTWTPPILDILKRYHVPATFFVIGENALEHPLILQRMVREGHQVGNHSYTHPNLAEVSTLGVKLELNATQRMIEAYTGYSTRLFRAPYFGDAEPTTLDELRPAAIAQSEGYTIVGLHADAEDWQRPGVDAIVANTLNAVHAARPDYSENIVLLHDGGGDRSQTVAALPIIIERLRAEGYQFVPVSELAGIPPDRLMPRVSGGDLLAVRADIGIFLLLAAIGYTIKWLFFFAIALGIARAVFMTVLAIVDREPDIQADPDPSFRPRVSVIIPAYNEERVIVASVRRVLASAYPDLHVVVADDGSQDRTSALVTEAFGDDPRVRLLTLVNGGKASALNRALAETDGDIVIALDADTQFPAATIAHLVRWFIDPKVGAVAGNAKVGNKVNIVTRWQAVEYMTAQNVERRALDALGAITVVPGAVGAWRREALDAVGGYPEDTLAEDQDLTIAIQRAGWRVVYDVEAIALTEAPETLRALGRQRYRWSFGTLQCLWKHRAVMRSGRPRGLALVGMPQAWLFQIIFAAISPMIDFALITSIVGTIIRVQQHGWAQTQTDVLRMGIYWLAFTSVDVLAGIIAYWLDGRGERLPIGLLISQRIVYRQLMYGVVIRSINSAVRGRVVGWGKLERSGRVQVSDAPSA